MKYLKILGLAAVAAMAMMAFAGSASATELKSGGTAGTKLGVGATLEASLEKSAILATTGGTTLATCTTASVKGSIGNAGGAGATVTGPVTKENLTWAPKGAGCTNTTHTIEGGELEIHGIAGSHNGTLTAKKFQVTVDGIFGVSCIFTAGTGTHMGTLTGAATATGHAVMDINATVTKTPGSSGFCPEKAVWTGNYKVTNQTGLVVVA
jgi:hypothetical protein